MLYVTGQHALNVSCSLLTCGDWHQSAIQWERPFTRESTDSVFGDYGIEHDVTIPEHTERYNVANHIRALLDLLELGKFTLAQGMNKDFICNDDYTNEVFDHVMILSSSPIWPDIDHFMEKEYLAKWLNYKVGDKRNKKYELVENERLCPNIRAIRDFGDVKAGDMGGYIEGEDSLSHAGDCWVYPTGIAWHGATVIDNAKVYGAVEYDAIAQDNSVICQGASVMEDAVVGGDVVLSMGEWVTGSARVMSDSSYITAVDLGYTAYRTVTGFVYMANERIGEYVPPGNEGAVGAEFWKIAQAFFDSSDESEKRWLKEQARTLHYKFYRDPMTGKLVMRPDAQPFDPNDYKISFKESPGRKYCLERIANLSYEKYLLLEKYLSQLEEY